MSKQSCCPAWPSRATVSRKEKDAAVLSKDESERVLGVESLIGMVQTMVEQSGDPATQLKYDVEGEYRLENGHSVRLSVVDGRLYLDLTRSHCKELQAVAPSLPPRTTRW